LKLNGRRWSRRGKRSTARQLTEMRREVLLRNKTNRHEKVLLFRSVFRGRTDVYPARRENKSSGKSGYAPACANEWVRGVCEKPRIKCGDCAKQAFIAVSDRVVERHLRGDIVAGIYPLVPGNTCYFVAVDFDGEGWIEDSRAFRHACSEHHVPVSIERSRSGAGAHAWIFFAEALMASQARQLATGLMSAALERRPDIGFRSYDRLFPSQDLMPDGGFGNLIALPLQRVARDRGHSVFIDDELNPFPDQWEYLASLKKIEVSVVERLLAVLSSRRHGITGIPLPISDETSPTPWALPQTSNPDSYVTEPLPKRVPVTLPISWKGTLAQYVGRLHREHADKRDVLVVDYSDLGVPMLGRMAAKRVAGYRNLGYVVEHIGVGDRRERAPATTVVPTPD